MYEYIIGKSHGYLFPYIVVETHGIGYQSGIRQSVCVQRQAESRR